MNDSSSFPDSESKMRAGELTAALTGSIETPAGIAGPPIHPIDQNRLFEIAAGLGVDAPLHDVAHSINNFSELQRLAFQHQQQLPCLRLRDQTTVPVDLSILESDINGSWLVAPKCGANQVEAEQGLRAINSDFTAIAARAKPTILSLETPQAAATAFREGLSNFLAYRLGGFQKWKFWMSRAKQNAPKQDAAQSTSSSGEYPSSPTAVTWGGGLSIEVTCVTAGLRIHISPAYFISWTVFGAPSFPVYGSVMPGRYVFAADGLLLPKFTIDNGVFPIPDKYQVELNQF